MILIIESLSIFGLFQCSMYILIAQRSLMSMLFGMIIGFVKWLCMSQVAIINLVIGSDSVVAYHHGIHRLRATQICSETSSAGDDSLSDLRWIGKQKRKNGQLGFECQLWWF